MSAYFFASVEITDHAAYEEYHIRLDPAWCNSVDLDVEIGPTLVPIRTRTPRFFVLVPTFSWGRSRGLQTIQGSRGGVRRAGFFAEMKTT